MNKERFISQEEMSSNLWQLFNRKFVIRMQYMDILDPLEVKLFGAPSSGDLEIDRQNAHYLTNRIVTIPMLLDYFKRGVSFWVNDKTDIHLIYSIITTHLREWRKYSQEGFEKSKIPVEDLKDLSDLATLLYKLRNRKLDQDDRFSELMTRQVIQRDKQPETNVKFYSNAMELLGQKEKVVEEVVEEDVPPHLEEIRQLDEALSRGNRYHTRYFR